MNDLVASGRRVPDVNRAMRYLANCCRHVFAVRRPGQVVHGLSLAKAIGVEPFPCRDSRCPGLAARLAMVQLREVREDAPRCDIDNNHHNGRAYTQRAPERGKLETRCTPCW